MKHPDSTYQVLAPLALAAAFFSTACASYPTGLDTRYKPLHPANGASVDFNVKAHDEDGIAKVELYLFEFELTTVNNIATAIQRPGGTWGLVRAWNYPNEPEDVDETYTAAAGFPAESSVKFIFRVTDAGGREKSESWSFAAGDWPFGPNPIPLWGNGEPADRIDVAFVADRDDFAQGRDMLASLEPLIFDGYHTNNVIGMGKKYWQFYYSPELGSITDFDDGAPFVLDIPASVASSGIIDAAGVIHTSVKRDWASMGNFGTEPGNKGTAAHESAHAAFGLADEYEDGGHFTSTDPHHNNFDSLGLATDYNTANGWPASDVEAVVAGTWWRPEPAALDCIMFNDGDATMPDFERTCLNRAVWIYSELEN